MTQLEDHVEKIRAENAGLRRTIREFAIKDAGFDPATAQGKAIDKLYDGPAEPDAVRQFVAQEFPEWSAES